MLVHGRRPLSRSRVGGTLDGVITESEADPSSLARFLTSAESEENKVRAAIGWHDELAEVDAETLERLFQPVPPLQPDRRWNALLAGLVENVCWIRKLRCPSWVHDERCFLDNFWWPYDTPSVRPSAIRDSPTALNRRGVMLSKLDLERV